MKQFIFILLSALCSFAHAQQSNHWVVQGYEEIIDTSLIFSNLDTLKKINYFDIDLNSPEIKVHKLSSNRIKYNYYGTPPTASTVKISQGYQTISNSKGELLAYVFNNVLYNNKGDSIDYLTQYGCKRGVASQISIADTFTLYYIQSKTEYNATSFESQYYNTNDPWQPTYKFHNDSFFLMEVKYFDNKRIAKERIGDFAKWGDINMLESNVVFFIDQFKEFRVQFVWDKFLYDVNVSRNNQTLSTQIIFQNTNEHIKMRWYDFSESGSHTPSALTVSPSGRWTVFNWYYSKFINNSYKYSITKAILITNNNLKVNQIVSDSGDNEKRPFLFWKNAVFTKNDSTFLLYTGQVENTRVKWKVLEVSIQGNNIGKSYFDILVDPSFTTGFTYNTITDLCLAPNGNNYAFFHRYSPRYLPNGQIRWILDFGLAKFVKNQTYYTLSNPIPVLQGLNSMSYQASDQDKIFFPATPTPYHRINFKYKSLCNDLTHEFTNETDTNWFDHFWWFWGDGDSTKSVKSQTKIRHQYTKPGKYKVLLKSITADGGWVWYSDSVEILPEPIAKYYTKNTVGCQWIAVEFSDSSILEKKSHTWKWDFGDGNDTTLTSPGNIMPKNKSIKHTYTTSGKFNVQLQVSDGRCTDSFNAIQNISILPAPRPGIAIDKTSGCTPLEVQFGRTYSDPTDSTIYRFKPVIVPTNHFDQAINKARLTQSGKYWLLQKLYGPSGCITQDSIALNITQGVEEGLKPFLKRGTVVNNANILTEWQTVPAAKNYQLYRNGMPLAVVNDTFYLDALSQEIDQSYRYQIQPIDSCDKTVALRSNVGKTIFLKVVEQAQVSVNEFPTALLTWTPYEDWSLSGGVQNYVCVGNLDKETTNWQLLTNQVDTQFNDKQFIERSKFEKCYRIQARSADGRFVTESNTACLGYTATLFAPNAFTPNGDGLNDAFEIFNYGFDRFTLSVYDRWGQKIYEASSSEAIWKPASDVPTGVYVYQVKAYKQDKEYGFSSTVTLLR
jgi:gliding motility-associated-like protein